MSKLVQTYLKLVQTGSNWSKLVQMIRETAFIIKLNRLRRKQKSEMWKNSIVAKLNLKTLLELQIMHGGRHWNSFMFWYFIRATCIQQHDFSNEKYSCSSLKRICMNLWKKIVKTRHTIKNDLEFKSEDRSSNIHSCRWHH